MAGEAKFYLHANQVQHSFENRNELVHCIADLEQQGALQWSAYESDGSMIDVADLDVDVENTKALDWNHPLRARYRQFRAALAHAARIITIEKMASLSRSRLAK
jgi:hypothetical protein